LLDCFEINRVNHIDSMRPNVQALPNLHARLDALIDVHNRASNSSEKQRRMREHTERTLPAGREASHVYTRRQIQHDMRKSGTVKETHPTRPKTTHIHTSQRYHCSIRADGESRHKSRELSRIHHAKRKIQDEKQNKSTKCQTAKKRGKKASHHDFVTAASGSCCCAAVFCNAAILMLCFNRSDW